MSSATTFYDFKPLDTKGLPYPLDELKGKVVLVVNTASKCGFTPQYDGLEKLYQDMKKTYGEKFTILAFPCNQFASQEPLANSDIVEACRRDYGVTFPVLGKIDVNGAHADPVYEYLKAAKPGVLGLKMVKWNFEKFLVSAEGKVVERWASTTKPDALRGAIERELGALEKPVA